MKKLTNKKGFTLMEMLIVVAIIVILVAISVPTFTSQLEKARNATDEANIRAAKASASTAYLALEDDEEADFYDSDDEDAVATRFYDAENGKLLETNTITEGYGKGSENSAKGKVIQVVIDKEGNVTCSWVAAAVTP